MTVDFDPHTLELSYSVTGRSRSRHEPAGAPRNTAPAQWTGASVTLTVTLIFDNTTTPGISVQQKTDPLVCLAIRRRSPRLADGPAAAPPAKVVHFQWGLFIFNGSVTSLSQTIDYFSADGVPLRATVNLSLERVDAPPPRAPPAVRPRRRSASGPG